MTQDDFLKGLWTDVINAVDRELMLDDAPKRKVRSIDFARVARLVRYETVFNWCSAFDDAGDEVSTWLRSKPGQPRWQRLVNVGRTPYPVADRDEPFADGALAWASIVDAGVSLDDLEALMRSEANAALSGIRTLLERGARELDGLHESLLTSDPSGLEGRPGSWPLRKTPPQRSRRVVAPTRRKVTARKRR